MAGSSHAEAQAARNGAIALQNWWQELALCTAWHTVFYQNQLDAGKLKPWSKYRNELRGTTATPVPMDWRSQKAALKAQVTNMKKHQAVRTRPSRRRGQ